MYSSERFQCVIMGAVTAYYQMPCGVSHLPTVGLLENLSLVAL